MGSPLHLTEVREAESRMALIFLKTVTLTGRARRAPPEDRDSTHVGNLDCQILSGGDLILSLVGTVVSTTSERRRQRFEEERPLFSSLLFSRLLSSSRTQLVLWLCHYPWRAHSLRSRLGLLSPTPLPFLSLVVVVVIHSPSSPP